MKRYTIFQAPIMAFFSSSFYRDVGLNWKGIGFAYLLLLLAVCCIIISIPIHFSFVDLVDNKAPLITPQIPPIKIINGEASVDVVQPYEIINSESGKVFGLIDTTGKVVSMEGTEARILLTKSNVIYKKNDGTTTGFDFKMVKNFTLDQQKVSNWLKAFRNYGAACVFLFIVIVNFVLRIVQVLIYAAIGLFFAKWCKTSQPYRTLLRLSVMAITPIIIVTTIFEIANITIPLRWLLFFIAAMGYLFFGVRVVSHKENA